MYVVTFYRLASLLRILMIAAKDACIFSHCPLNEIICFSLLKQTLISELRAIVFIKQWVKPGLLCHIRGGRSHILPFLG